jgi:hypothetical protein
MFHGLLAHFMDAVWLLPYMTGSVDCKINSREGYGAIVPYVTHILRKKKVIFVVETF